jgi:hypothetical protein
MKRILSIAMVAMICSLACGQQARKAKINIRSCTPSGNAVILTIEPISAGILTLIKGF